MCPKLITAEEYPQHFWAYVDRRGIDECWPFTMSTNHAGYGSIMFQKRPRLAHRVAWTLVKGAIPKGLCVLHSCDNPPCCNPQHLFLGTRLDNNKDKGRKKRGRSSFGEAKNTAKLTEAQVIEIRRLYKPHAFSLPRLAKMFGVTHGNIEFIVKRKTWKHVP